MNNSNDLFFYIAGIVAIVGSVLRFLYITLGRIFGFYRPLGYREGGKSSFLGEMCFLSFILILGIASSKLVSGNIYAILIPLMIIAWMIGFFDQMYATKKAKKNGDLDEVTSVGLDDIFERPGEKREKKNIIDLAHRLPLASERTKDINSSWGKAFEKVYKYGLLFGVYSFIISIIAIGLLFFIPFRDDIKTDLFGYFGGFGAGALMLAFTGLNGIPLLVFFVCAVPRFARQPNKTSLEFGGLLIAGLFGAFLTYLFFKILFAIIL